MVRIDHKPAPTLDSRDDNAVPPRGVRPRVQRMPPPGAVRPRRLLPERQVRNEHLAGPDSQMPSTQHQARVRPDHKAMLPSHILDAQVQRRPPSRKADIVE